MTAEERVRWLIQFLPTSPGNFDQQRAFLACAAQMVRAAENEALEGAAKTISGDRSLDDGWGDYYAERIRFLKSEPEGK